MQSRAATRISSLAEWTGSRWKKFLRNEGYEIVVDATHPYAQVVYREHTGRCEKTQSFIYLRLEREISGLRKQRILPKVSGI